MTWSDAMFGTADHFEFFLNNVEDGILKGARIKYDNRERIIRELDKLRGLTHQKVATLEGETIVNAIRELRNDVCKAKDNAIKVAERQNLQNKILKTALVSVIVINAVGSIMFPQASPAALAASVTLGGVAQFVPDLV